MIVSGDEVTPDHAAEIIIRTSDLYFCSNDNDWRRMLHGYLGILPEKESNGYVFPDYNKQKKLESELGILKLEYLQNDQIASSYIGGPHGWCSWDGIIGTDGYNIGKWPSVDTVFNEWTRIAEAWPFLKLRCQLWNCECDSDHDDDDEPAEPIVEYLIENGTVTMVDPTQLRSPVKHGMNFAFLIPGGERGCTFEQFERAVQLARKTVMQNN
ncbi:Hypothetical protein HVR_LOCUS502 [uncultured virus]|nr:Hypothetical protein HVR_LOCUS502 [uncultured virus]